MWQPYCWQAICAAWTGGLPGPRTFLTFGIDSVPKASAAIPAGPLTLKRLVMPSSAATQRTAGSTSPVPPGTGGTTTASSGTPATTAGVPICTSTEGKEPLPLGMKSPALATGVIFSPTVRPGAISLRHSRSRTSSSLKARTLAMPAAIAARTSSGTWLRACSNSSSLTFRSPGATWQPSNFSSARQTAASPCSRTSSTISATAS